MKNLLEVSRVLTKKKVRKIEIIDDAVLDNPDSKFGQFFEALMGGKLRNDRDAATLLYKCKPTEDKYRQLKSRFRKRLLNTLFFLDINTPSAGNYERAYFSCNKDWTLVKILIANEAHQSAMDLARQILTVALRFNFADMVVNTCRILRDYAASEGNQPDFDEYGRHFKHFTPILQAEYEGEEAYQRIRMKMRLPKEELSEGLAAIDEQCDRLVELSERFDSPVIYYNMYMGWILRFGLQQDYASLLQICEQAEEYIARHPEYYQDNVLAAFQLNKISAYLHLADFNNGKITAEKALETFTPGSVTWLSFLEYYFLLALHTGNVIPAMAIYGRAVNHPLFRKIDYQIRERWKVYEVYLHYFVSSIGAPTDNIPTVGDYRFKLSRFLSDPIVYPKNQRVFTIHLVIAQLLFSIQQANDLLANDCVSRLRLYANKQLKPEQHARLILFIRLLIRLQKAGFEAQNLSGEEKHLEALRSEPFHYRGLQSEWEIVPYEKLWNHLLKACGQEVEVVGS